jgi:zinc transporter ZupT
MLAASFGLIYEGVNQGLFRTLAGALLGLEFIVAVRRLLRQDEHQAVFAGMGGLDARKALLIVGVMTLHSFTEGVGIGVSFGGGEALRLGFAAGAMIWMVFSELVPDSLEEASENLIAVVITLSIVAMVAFQVLIR